MSNQHVFELTDEQVKAIEHWTTIQDVSFRKDGTVYWADWRDHDVRVFTFRTDGSVILEERDFFSDGWETYTFDTEGELDETVG